MKTLNADENNLDKFAIQYVMSVQYLQYKEFNSLVSGTRLCDTLTLRQWMLDCLTVRRERANGEARETER